MGLTHFLLQLPSHLWLGTPNTGKSAPVNQVLPESEQEKILWEEAKESNKLRKKKRVERKKAFENEDSDRLNALSLKFLPSPNLIAL